MALTTVSDTLYNSAGGLANGTITVSWPTFYSSDNHLNQAGSLTITVTNGVLSQSLEPTDTGSLTPGGPAAGVVYTAVYAIISGPYLREFWNVPTSASSVSLAQVRTLTLPPGTSVIPNVANVLATYNFTGSNVLLTSAFNFAPLSPGGSLVIGSNTINVTNCPAGVNGSNANHYLYISGGTGAAEAVLITGGTAVAGGSGTLIFTCVNTHSGAWTLSSATAGCQEAFYSNGGVGAVAIQFPGGIFHFKAPCSVGTTQAVTISGVGCTATSIVQDTPNVDIFQFQAGSTQNGNQIINMSLTGQASSTSGYAINISNQAYFAAFNLLLFNVANGINVVNMAIGDLDKIKIRNLNGGSGIVVNGANPISIDRFETDSATPFNASLQITSSGNVIVRNSQLLGANYGVQINPGNGQTVAFTDFIGCFFDHDQIYGAWFHASGTGAIIKTRFLGCEFSDVSNAVQIDSTGTVAGVLIDDSELLSGAGNGIVIAGGSDISILNSPIANMGGGSGIVISAQVTNLMIQGCEIGNNIYGLTGGTQAYGIFFSGNLGAGLNITDNVFVGNSTAPMLLTAPAVAGQVISNNIGVDDQIAIVSSGGTISLPSSGIPTISLSGTTTVTIINGGWVGRRVYFIKRDAGTLTVGGGGNVPATHTLTSASAGFYLTWDGSNWY